ncbi:MAG: hypothetical protein U1U88_001166 [Lawsonella clevelandensis]
MFPEFAPQIMARASEVGYNRVVMGVHYPLDTIAGRMTGTASMAWHFADSKFYPLIAETAKETRAIIEKACGTTIMKCWAQGSPFLSEAESIRVYTERMNFGFPVLAPIRMLRWSFRPPRTTCCAPSTPT